MRDPFLAKLIGSSHGAQEKFLRDGVWYKKNLHGYEGLAEELCSVVLSCSGVKEYVTYERCDIDGKPGCRSDDFTKNGEVFLSFQRLYEIKHGGELEGVLIPMDSPAERINFTREFVEESTGLDVSDYISKTLAFDMLVLNSDRHLNNLGVISDTGTGAFRLAPIFDNGAALLSDYVMFPPDIDINEVNVPGKPFSSNLEQQAVAAGINLKIDYDLLYEKLKQYDEENTFEVKRALMVLRKQLKKYERILGI